MNKSTVLVLFVAGITTSLSTLADKKNTQYAMVKPADHAIMRSVQTAQGQISMAGNVQHPKFAGLIAEASNLQSVLIRKQIISRNDIAQMKSLVARMDRAAAGNPAPGTPGACFVSCDDAYGSGFGGGKGWNRFWCKTACLKIKVKAGPVGVDVGGKSKPKPRPAFSSAFGQKR